MKNFVRICLVLVLLSPAMAMAAPASDASIKELMAITETRKLIESLPAQVEAQMTSSIQQKLAGKTVTPAQQQAVDNLKKKVTALIADECSYAKMEPMFLPIYRETFSEEEVAGMIAFYKTPAGEAVIHKMPVLMQKTMGMQQQMLMQVMPKIQEIQQQFAAEMEKASK